MGKAKALIALFLCTAILLCIFAGCGKNAQSQDDTQNQSNQEQIGCVPAEVNFNGAEFTVLCRESNPWGNWEDEIHADEQETDVVNQAVYERNLAVAEALVVEVNVIAIPGHWTDAEDFTNTFRTSILAGDGAFDIVVGQQGYMKSLANVDLYMNVYDLPYVKDDLDSPYFYQDLVNELTVNNKLNYLIGDYTITYLDNVNVMFFNKQIAENENIGDVYQLVRDGEWTIDKCIELSKGVYHDLDGNGYKNENDLFGYITDYGNTTDGFYSQFDTQHTKKDEGGNIIIDMDVGKTVAILEKMIEFFKTDDVFTYSSSSSQTPDETPFNTIFTEDRALFYPDVLATAKTYRGMETDFGIVPVPKWEGQDRYLTQAQAGYSVVIVPIDVTDLEKVGAVCDALFAKSEEIVIPAYYDMALKGKFARDNESGEMIDIIREGLCINFGFFYDVGGGSIFSRLLESENSNFASYYAANKKMYERNLKTVLKTFEDEEE